MTLISRYLCYVTYYDWPWLLLERNKRFTTCAYINHLCNNIKWNAHYKLRRRDYPIFTLYICFHIVQLLLDVRGIRSTYGRALQRMMSLCYY